MIVGELVVLKVVAGIKASGGRCVSCAVLCGRNVSKWWSV